MPAGDQLHIAVAQAPADRVDGGDAVDDGRAGADGDQRVHVGRAVEQRAEADLVILAVDVHDRQRQQQLAHRVGNGILVAAEQRRQRPAQHVPHGEVHQRHQKGKRDDQPPLHGGEFVGHRRGAGLGGGRLFAAGRRLRRGAVAAGLDGGADLRGRQGLVVVLDGHRVLQQIDRHGLHARQLAHALFHMRAAGRAGHAGDIKFLFHGNPPGILA